MRCFWAFSLLILACTLNAVGLRVETHWVTSSSHLELECVVTNPSDTTYYIMASSWEFVSCIDSLDDYKSMTLMREAANRVFFFGSEFNSKLGQADIFLEFYQFPKIVAMTPHKRQVFDIYLPYVYKILAEQNGPYCIAVALHWCNQAGWEDLLSQLKPTRGIKAVPAGEKDEFIDLRFGHDYIDNEKQISIDSDNSVLINHMFDNTIMSVLQTK